MKRTLTTFLIGLLVLSSVATLPSVGMANAQQAAHPADLAIEQPDYVGGEVDTSTVNGTNVYSVNYGEISLRPQNIDSDDVVSHGVEEDVGSLSYDSEFDEYEFDAEGHNGTFTVWWVVETEQVVNGSDGNETVTTDTQRYEAIIDVTQTPEYQHYEAGALEETREAADNWDQYVVDRVRSISGEDADVVSEVQYALDLLNFRRNPGELLTGGYWTAVLIVLGLAGIGGSLLFLQGTIVHYAVRLAELMRLRKIETRRADEDTIDEKIEEQDLRDIQRALDNNDWNDIPGVSDRFARALRETLGENVRHGSIRLAEMLRPMNLIHDRLLAMGQNGWVAVVTRDASTDGGEGDDGDDNAQGAITTVELKRESELDRSELAADQAVDTLDEPSEELIAMLDWDSEALRQFDLAEASFDPEESGAELRGIDFEELMRETNASRQDFETPRNFGLYIQQLIEHVREHEFTDTDGRINEVRWVMNELLNIANVEDDLFDFPLLAFAGEGVERQLIEDDPVEEAHETVRKIKEGSA